jgi:hypothetical protein
MKRLLAVAGLAALLATTGAAASGGGVSKKAPQHKTGQYVGKTGEPAPVLLIVGKKRVKAVGVAGKADCTDVQTGETKSFRLHQQIEASYFRQARVWTLDREGRFDGTLEDRKQVRGRNAFELHVKGRVKGSRVTGKVGYTSELASKSCDFPTRRFTAKWTGKDEYGRGPSSGPGPRR